MHCHSVMSVMDTLRHLRYVWYVLALAMRLLHIKLLIECLYYALLQESMEGTQDEFIDAELEWLARSAKDLPPSSSAGTVSVSECIDLAPKVVPGCIIATSQLCAWVV